jgi:hypothetical protein
MPCVPGRGARRAVEPAHGAACPAWRVGFELDQGGCCSFTPSSALHRCIIIHGAFALIATQGMSSSGSANAQRVFVRWRSAMPQQNALVKTITRGVSKRRKQWLHRRGGSIREQDAAEKLA